MYKINRGVRINVVINTCAELALLAQICELPLQRYNQGGEENRPGGNQDLSSLHRSTHRPPVEDAVDIFIIYEKTFSTSTLMAGFAWLERSSPRLVGVGGRGSFLLLLLLLVIVKIH